MMKNIQTLEKVKLREIWKHEAHDFTRWLALEENINLLLDQIGVTAENIKTEDSAGKFNVDITAEEVNTGKKIVIENQLEKTDHTHLGQLLTYASSFDACIIVWVVGNVRDEHKRAIEWFNEHMSDEVSFFLVRTEVFRIGDSDPAVNFNVVVEPNSWSKIVRNRDTSDKVISETKLNHLRFWESFKDYSEEIDTPLKIGRSPRAQSWYDIAIGSRRGHLTLTRNIREGYISTSVWIPNDMELFTLLRDNKEKFHSIVGTDKIDWAELEDKKASYVRLKKSCDVSNSEHFKSHCKWYIESAEKFRVAFNEISK